MEMTGEQRLLVEKAALGCQDSQFELGRLHAFGVEGFSKDLEKAFFWLKKAAADGQRGAMGLLIGVLFEIDADNKHWRLFYRYIKKLADSQDPMAMMDLGLIYCGAAGHFPLLKYPELKSHFNFNQGFEMIRRAANIAAAEGADLIPPYFYKSASDIFAAKIDGIIKKEIKLENEYDIFDLLDMELMLMIRAHSGAQKAGVPAALIKEYNTAIEEIRAKMERLYEAKKTQAVEEQPINEAAEMYKRYGRL
jgi:TPR repeat protein